MNRGTETDTNITIHWRHGGIFLALNFGLTWLLDLAIYLRGGLRIPGIVAALQLQMLLPAFSAIVLGLFFFPESPIYHSKPAGRARWFYYYFLLLVLIYALGTLSIWLSPSQSLIALLTSIPLVLAFLGLLILIGLRMATGREATAAVWLVWGSWRFYLLFGVPIIVYYILQTVLNAVFGLGPAQPGPIPAPPGFNSTTFLNLGAAQSVLMRRSSRSLSPLVRSTAGADTCKASCSSWAGCVASFC